MKRLVVFLIASGVFLLLGTTLPTTGQQIRDSLSRDSIDHDFGIRPLPPGAKGGGKGFSVDYAFKGNQGQSQDGALPTAAVIQDPATGNLYGTTSQGGNAGCNGNGCGTVFKLDTSNHEMVLYMFKGGTDGATPNGRLALDASGNLYGTTSLGGTFNLGTVFKIDPSGNETVIHRFGGNPDGANPYAGLVMDGAGNLYGTTENGGTGTACPNSCGTVFKIDASGNETVLHSFAGGPNDGADPKAGVTLDASSGNLYGTTFTGGSSSVGTVFQLAPDGTETILWHFTGGSDGANPFGGVIRDVYGVLYGTTEYGGTHPLLRMGGPLPDGRRGCCVGIAYSLNGSSLNVLYTFTGKNDGGNPTCDLVLKDGVLYGTTANGGHGTKGTAFSLVVASKTETVLHGFGGGFDGATPQAGLLMNGAGVLYGTATGAGKSGHGTVFQYKTK